MTEEERKLHENIKRVSLNLLVLLDIGLYPGKHSVGIEECKAFVRNIMDESVAKLSALIPPQAPAVTDKHE